MTIPTSQPGRGNTATDQAVIKQAKQRVQVTFRCGKEVSGQCNKRALSSTRASVGICRLRLPRDTSKDFCAASSNQPSVRVGPRPCAD
eukprot:scaffold1529_cov404-Prasinococcus_capsulatus_cf.AAC.3